MCQRLPVAFLVVSRGPPTSDSRFVAYDRTSAFVARSSRSRITADSGRPPPRYAIAGALAMGFVGGAVAWFATNFWGKPISKFLDLRLQAQETILFHANIGPYLADAERTPKASDDLRRIAAQIGGITATSSPLILWCFESAATIFPSRPRN